MATNPILSRLDQELGAALEEIDESLTFHTAPPAKIIDDAVSNATLKQVQQGIENQTVATQNFIQSMEANAAQSGTIQTALEAGIRAGSEANQTVQRAELVADKKAENFRLAAHEAGGGDEEFIDLMQRHKVNRERSAALADRKVDIMDNVYTKIPLVDDVINSIHSTQIDSRIFAAEAAEAQTSDEIRSLGAATETVKAASINTRQTLNEGVIEATLAKQAASDAVALSTAQMQGINANSTRMTQLYTANQQEFSNLMRVNELENSIEGRRLAKIRSDREQARFEQDLAEFEGNKEFVALNLEVKRAQVAALTDPKAKEAAELALEADITKNRVAKATDAAMIQAVRKGQESILSFSESDEIIRLGFNSNLKEQKEKYVMFASTGASPNQRIGNSVSESLRSYAVASPTGNIKENANTRLVQGIKAAVDQDIRENPTTLTPTGSQAAIAERYATMIDNKAKEVATEAAKVIATGDSTNPYHAAPMAVLSDMAAIKETALYTEVLEPLNLQEFDPQVFIDAAASAVVAGTLKHEEMIDGITAIGQAAIHYNNTIAGGPSRVGFPEQTSYNVLVRRATTAFDVLSAAAVGADFTAAALSVIPGLGPITAELLPATDTPAQLAAKIVATPQFELYNIADPAQVRLLTTQELSGRGSQKSILSTTVGDLVGDGEE